MTAPPHLAAAAAKANERRKAERLGRIEDAHYLHSMGEHPDRIAARIGVCPERLERYLATPVAVPEAEDLASDGQDGPVPALEPERRIARAKPLAADLARCVAADDAEGVRILLHRAADWVALVIVLAECAEPARTAAVTGAGASRRPAARRDQGAEVAA